MAVPKTLRLANRQLPRLVVYLHYPQLVRSATAGEVRRGLVGVCCDKVRRSVGEGAVNDAAVDKDASKGS